MLPAPTTAGVFRSPRPPRPTANLPVMGPVVVALAQGAAHDGAAYVQRAMEFVTPPTADAPTPPWPGQGEPLVVQRFSSEEGSAGTDVLPVPASPPRQPAVAEPSVAADTDSTTALLDRVEEMVAQIEERILEELERRGGRFAGYF